MEISWHREGGPRLILDVSPGGQCLCGSKKRFADCCLWIVRHGPIQHREGAHLAVQFADLYSDATVDGTIVEAAKLGSKEKVILELARMNFYVNKETNSDDRRRREEEIARSAFPEHVFNKIQLLYAYGRRGGMFPKTSLLEAIRRVALLPPNQAAQADAVPLDRLVAYSIACGMKVGEFENAAIPKAGEEVGALCSLQFAQRFYDRAVDLGVSLARSWIFMKEGVDEALKKFRPQCVDLREQFESVMGCPWTAWLGIGVAVRGMYDHPREVLSGDGFLFGQFNDIKDPKVQEQVQKALDHMSAKEDWLKQSLEGTNILQYFKFYERPLFQNSAGNRFPFDVLLLERRVLDGTYWAIVEHLGLKGDKKGRDAVNRTWGKVFEWYVHRLLSPLHGRLQVYTDWKDKFEAPEGCSLPDAIVVEGETALVFENCVTFPSPLILAGGDAKELQKAFERVWFGSPERDAAKVEQLLGASKTFREGKLKVNDHALVPPKRIVPILAGLRSIPREAIVRAWVERVLTENKVSAEDARSLIFLSVDELEELAAELERGRGLQAAVLPFADLAHARRKVGGTEYRPKWLQVAMTEAFNELTLKLFGKPLNDQRQPLA